MSRRRGGGGGRGAEGLPRTQPLTLDVLVERVVHSRASESMLKPFASAPFMVLPINSSRLKMRASLADETSSRHASTTVRACSSRRPSRDDLRTWNRRASALV